MYKVPQQAGRTFVITGANSGTGKEATRQLAAAGATVIMAVRNLEKGEAARAEILAATPEATLELRHIDLADLASVRTFAQGIIDDKVPLDVLVNNAGVMVPPKRIETVDGFELQFGSNFLGPFALTNLLLPRLLERDGSRVTTMTSFVANRGKIHFHDLQWTRRYSKWAAYSQSKLADMLMAMHLAEVATQRGWSLTSTIAHPGYTRTNLQTAGASLGREAPLRRNPNDFAGLFSQDVVAGTEPLLIAATNRKAKQGEYYGPSRRFGLVGPTKYTTLPRSSRSREQREHLWAVAKRLTGTSLPPA